LGWLTLSLAYPGRGEVIVGTYEGKQYLYPAEFYEDAAGVGR
jgi:hypothetical protein